MFNRNHLSEMKWFEGVVEDRMDPLKAGRVRVRIIGLHTESLVDIPEADLRWAHVMLPTTSATMNGIGETPGLVEGQHVIGFFRDGDSSQEGIIIGSIPGIPVEERNKSKGFYDHREDLSSVPCKPKYDSPNSFSDSEKTPYPRPEYLEEPDINRLARNEKVDIGTILESKKKSRTVHTGVASADGSTIDEPEVQYGAKYPYNKVTETESGHVIELDDTPGNERVTITHRSGTTVEMHKNGDILLKTIRDEYDLVAGKRKSHVVSDDILTVDANRNVYVKSNVNLKVDGDVNWMVGGNVNWMVGGNISWNVQGITSISSSGSVSITSSSNITNNASGNVTINGSTISLN